MDPRRFRTLSRGSLTGKEGPLMGTDGSIGSPLQSNSPKVDMLKLIAIIMLKFVCFNFIKICYSTLSKHIFTHS